MAALRTNGGLRSDRSGRAPTARWVAAALSARRMIPSGEAGDELTVLRRVLGARSVGQWMREDHGLDGSQTNHLRKWLRRISLLPSPHAAALTTIIQWACGGEPYADEAAGRGSALVAVRAKQAWLARLLASTCREAHAAADDAWPVLRLQAMRTCPGWRAACSDAWRLNAPNVSRAEQLRRLTQSAATQLRDLGGGNRARFWRSVGAAVAGRNSQERKLKSVPNRLLEDTISFGPLVAGRVTRTGAEGGKQVRCGWGKLRSMLDATRGDKRVAMFRAVWMMLEKYDSWL